MPAEQPAPPKPKLRWYQYRLRSLFILTFLVAVACSWLAVKMEQARKQKEAVDALIIKKGIHLRYDYEINNSEIYGPVWLRSFLGDDFFNDVSHVWINNYEAEFISDSDIRYLEDLQELQFLEISGRVHISVDGLKFLDRLLKLEILNLINGCFNDESLKHIAHLKRLKSLILRSDRITEKGLTSLKGLKQLRELSLIGCKITDAHLEQIKEFPQLHKLSLDGCEITDTHLEHIKELQQLQTLSLVGSKISDAHLEQIKELRKLDELILDHDSLGAHDSTEIRKSLPSVNVIVRYFSIQ